MKYLKYKISLKISLIIISISFVIFLLLILFSINKYSINIERKSLEPYEVTITMPKNTKTERNFTWHTSKYTKRSDIEIIKANSNKKNINFKKGKVIRSSGKVLKQMELYSYVHRVKVKNLKPNTKYYYRVGDKINNKWSQIGEFITDSSDNHFKFLYISDQQAYDNEKKEVLNSISSIKRYISNSEFIVNAGDFVNDTCDKRQWKNSLDFSLYGNTTLIAAPGNHDYSFGCTSNYTFSNNFYYDYDKQDNKSGLYYSLNYDNVHIIVLNTNYNYYSELNKKQINWLLKDLKSSTAKKAKYRIVIMHRGVYTTGPHYYNHKDILPLTKQLTPIFADNKVDLVLQGHDHTYSLTYPINREGNIDSVNYKQVYSKEINKNIDAMENNNPIYFIGDAFGPKHHPQLIKENSNYVTDPNMNKSHTNLVDSKTLDNYFSKFKIRSTPYSKNKKRYKVFSSIEVDDNKLIVNSYTIDSSKKKIKLYKSFALIK